MIVPRSLFLTAFQQEFSTVKVSQSKVIWKYLYLTIR
jgi:hypothetical protein